MARWVNGELTNYDYLIELNRLAGRDMRAGNPHFHPVFPWVIDFSSTATSGLGSFRDLTKTKFRLKKGDEQLDFTYKNSSSIVPHHITETLSEITYYVYLARRTPVDILKRVVRHKFIPEEYPPSMERIYKWTPDECIPEFFSDPTIFTSMHTQLGLDDLKVPEWCSSPEHFIQRHREVLESDAVSSNLHHWINLTFGYQLCGEAAVTAKNVPLPLTSARISASPGAVNVMTDELSRPWVNHQLHNKGIIQLFARPHVPRKTSSSHARASKPLLPCNRRWASVKEELRPRDGRDTPGEGAPLEQAQDLTDKSEQEGWACR